MTGIYRKINYICLTEFTKNKIKSVVPENRIYIKPNFTYDYGGVASPLDYYLFVGRLEEIKGINMLVEAFSKMPNRILYVVGTGPLEDDIRNRIVKENICNIRLLGYKNREELNEIMRGAKALIMCSQWYETFGMVIIEAYSNGTPVIVGDIGNIECIVKHHSTGIIFRYNSCSALIKAITEFEGGNHKSYQAESYSFYLSNYHPEINYKQLVVIYSLI